MLLFVTDTPWRGLDVCNSAVFGHIRTIHQLHKYSLLLFVPRLFPHANHTQWPGVVKVAMWHRTGLVPTGEASVIIAASAVHRKEAIEAVEWGV